MSVLILLFLLAFLAGTALGKRVNKSQKDFPKRGEKRPFEGGSQKEIKNFLNYDGSRQE